MVIFIVFSMSGVRATSVEVCAQVAFAEICQDFVRNSPGGSGDVFQRLVRPSISTVLPRFKLPGASAVTSRTMLSIDTRPIMGRRTSPKIGGATIAQAAWQPVGIACRNCCQPPFARRQMFCRITDASLAAEIGLSPSACLRRINMLEQEGVIRGYTALLGGAGGDSVIAVIINITLERQTKENLNRFELAARKHPEIQECYLMTGGSDYLLRVEVENAGDFERIHKEILSKLPGILRIHSSFSIRNVLVTRSKRPLHWNGGRFSRTYSLHRQEESSGGGSPIALCRPACCCAAEGP
jgi:DNA-binding Lrp family transcriptional regulator